MWKALKILLVVVLVTSLASGTVVLATGAIVYSKVRHGMNTGDFGTWGIGDIAIDVHDKTPGGQRFGLRFPSMALNALIYFAPAMHLDSEAAHEIGQHAPLFRAAAKAINELPDGVYVEVLQPAKHEHMRIAKRRGSFVIDVDTPDEAVHLALPLSTFSLTANKLALAAD